MAAPERISRYPILRQLGAGGMGQVYLARDPDLDRRVALKVLRSDAAGDSGARKRLRDEARALAALNHPGIVTVYEIGRDGDVDFIAMEYIDGKSLRDAIASKNQVPSTETLLAAAGQVARALAAAHSTGVLHRDVKPDNVMIDRSGAVKVVDFGLAHRIRAPSVPPEGGRGPSPFSQTMPDLGRATMVTNTIFGTPGYMPPELLVGERATASSDVYSLGVSIYQLLTGELPYTNRPGEDLEATLLRVIDQEQTHPPLRQVRPDLGDDVCDLVARMLSKRAGERPLMSEVAAALEPGANTSSRPFQSLLGSTSVAEIAASAAPTVRAAAAAPTRAEAPPSGRGRRTLAIVALAVAAAGSITAVLVRRDRPSTTLAVAPSAPRRLIVANLQGRFSGYGNSAPGGGDLAMVLTETLAGVGVDVVKLGSAARRSDVIAQGKRAGADAILQLKIEHDGDVVTGSLAIRSVVGGEVVLARDIRSASLAEVIFESARVTAKAFAPPGTELRKDVADVAFQLGLGAYSERKYNVAAPFFEQAVTAKPEFPVAWYYLAWARAWVAAPSALTLEAANRAREMGTTDHERRLGSALVSYLDHRYREAATILEPLLETAPRDRELLYLYAESLFHDGQINASLPYFERCLAVAPDFKPARTHLHEVAAARRSVSDLRRLYGGDTESLDGILAYIEGDDDRARDLGFATALLDVVAGRYQTLDETYKTASSGRGVAYRLARLVELDRAGEARKLFRSLWPELERAGAEPAGAFALQAIGRVLLVGELDDELRVMLRWWQNNDTPSNLSFRRELELFSPPVLGAPPARFPDANLTTREITIQRALALEAAGELEATAADLRSLVDEPAGSYRDYTLQHALLRILIALGAVDELRQRCAVWSRPPRFDEALIVLRKACRDAAAE